MNILLALIISIFSALMPNNVEALTQAPAPATQVVDEVSWEQGVLNKSQLELPTNTYVYITDQYNCGSELSPEGIGGGCTYEAVDGTTVITVSPYVVGTPAGEHILLHEVAHAHGIMDECAAEEYAHTFSDYPYIWSYPQCNILDVDGE